MKIVVERKFVAADTKPWHFSVSLQGENDEEEAILENELHGTTQGEDHVARSKEDAEATIVQLKANACVLAQRVLRVIQEAQRWSGVGEEQVEFGEERG